MYKEDVKIYYHIKHNPRDIQLDALDFTKEQIRHGKKYILLNMPTGSGKSLFSIMFINWYLNYINKDAKFDILTNSKILQQQYVNEFHFIANVKGRNSYRCRDYSDASCEEGNELNKAFKKKCHDCPYEKAQEGWINNRVGLTNFHYFNSICLYKKELLVNKDPNVLIIDEAHGFADILCENFSNRISKTLLKRMGFIDAETNTIYQDIKFIKSVDEYANYIKDVFINRLNQKIGKIETKIIKSSLPMGEKVKLTKSLNLINKTLSNYNTFLTDYQNNPSNWIIDFEYTQDKYFSKNIIVEPIWSYPYLPEYIWDKFDHVIMMSSTILNKNQFCYMNGIEKKLTSYCDFESPFDIKNRKVFYLKGVGKMSYDSKENTFNNQLKYIDKIINKYKDKKGVIHTFSYELSKKLEEVYKDNDRFIFHDPENINQALEEHYANDKASIIVSPSLISGIDFKDDYSRFQLILKIPYPSLGSKKIKKRLEINKEWYSLKTCADLIQMSGRGVRSYDDYCDTFILDDSFSNLLQYSYKYLPKWYTDSIKVLKI